MEERRNIYFLSDLHLGSRLYDKPLDAERRVVAFLDSIKNDAREILFVGDVLDYWFEYKYVVPQGFVRFFGKVAELSDLGVKITWFTGNHDIWIFDYLPRELGIEVVNGSLIREYNGKRFFIEHGDGLGMRPRKERFMRAVFRNKVCQKMFSWIHPRWTVPLAYGWSHSNRLHHELAPPYGGLHEPLVVFSRQFLEKEPIDYFIYGHRHLFITTPITTRDESRHSRVIFLGEWIDTCSYAIFDGKRLELDTYEP